MDENTNLNDYEIFSKEERRKRLNEIHGAKVEAISEVRNVAYNLRISLNIMDSQLKDIEWIKKAVLDIKDRLADIENNTHKLRDEVINL